METLFDTPIICPVLIGRAPDLATLHLLIDQAKGGRVHMALISGEAGFGKSRLVAEAKTYAAPHNFLLLQGNCFPTDFSCPYAPLVDLLRSSVVSLSYCFRERQVSLSKHPAQGEAFACKHQNVSFRGHGTLIPADKRMTKYISCTE